MMPHVVEHTLSLADTRIALGHHYEALLSAMEPGLHVVESTTGSGKTITLAQRLVDLDAHGRWPTVALATGGTRPARILYLAPTIAAATAFAEETHGLAVVRLGRQSDPTDDHGCAELPWINRLGQRGHETWSFCTECLGTLQALSGRPNPCNFRDRLAQSPNARLVVSPAQAFLNDTGAIDQFDIVFVDKTLVPHLLDSITITRADLDAWREGMDLHDAAHGAHDAPCQYGPMSPSRRLVDALAQALVSAASTVGWTWPTLMPLLHTVCPDLSAVVRGLTALLGDVQPFEEPRGMTIPLRCFRDLVTAIAAELDRSEGADTRLWITRNGIHLYRVRDDLVAILRRKVVINLDATPNPLLTFLFPIMTITPIEVPAYVHITQITDVLGTKRQFTQGPKGEKLRRRHEGVMNLLMSGMASPVVICFKTLNPDAGRSMSALILDHLFLRYGHWGRDERALNTFSDADGLFLLGRYTPPINELEAEVQALRFSANPPPKTGPPTRWLRYIQRDLSAPRAGRNVKSHPDPDVDDYIRWSEATSVIQAIGRGRAVLRSPEQPLRVFLFSALPIHGLVVDRLATLEEFGAPPSQRGISSATNEARDKHQTIVQVEQLLRVQGAIVRLRERGQRLTKRSIAREATISCDTLNVNRTLRQVVEAAIAADRAAKSDGGRRDKDSLCHRPPSLLIEHGDDLFTQLSLTHSVG